MKFFHQEMKRIKYFDMSLSMMCLIGFSYQSYYLFGEFMSGKTVVNIQIGQKLDGIPAISVMLGSVSLEKFTSYSKVFKRMHRNYTRLVNLSQNSSMYKVRAGHLYFQAHDEVLKQLQQDNIKVGQLFYNYTADCRTKDNGKRIHAKLSLVANLKLKVTEKVNRNKEFILHDDPDASLILESRLWKWYTIFSEIHRSWSDVSNNFTQIVIKIDYDINSWPLMYNPNGLILHSPDDLPLVDRGKIKMLNSNTFYMGQYSQIKIERLGEQYDTDCVHYGTGKKFIIRNDCLLACHQDKHDQVCEDKSKMVKSSYLVREAIVEKNAHKYISNCDQYEKLKQEVTRNCSEQCKQPCTYSYYPVSFLKLGSLPFGQIRIHIEHNEMPDILIKYFPETSFISFVCNFGGLLGMWLGLSFLSMAKRLKLIVSKMMTLKQVFEYESEQKITMSNRFYTTPFQLRGSIGNRSLHSRFALK